MTRTQIHRWSGVLPVLMSAAALGLVLAVVSTGWERHLGDEGVAAHLFQLLIAGELPLLAAFWWTADRGDARRLVPWLAVQAGALAAAFGAVAAFHL